MMRCFVCFVCFLLCSTAAAADTPNHDFFLQARELRAELRRNQQERLSGQQVMTCISAPGQEQFDVHHYELNLALDPETETITGTVNIKARSRVAGLQQVCIDLFNDMAVSAVTGNASGFSHANDIITIDLNRTYGNGEIFQIMIAYSGQPVESSQGLGFHFRTAGGYPAISNDSYPYFARSWWPCKDDPSDKSDSVDMVITVPDELTVICNGALRSVTDNPGATKTFHWHEGYPIATYLVAIAAARYTTFSDIYHSQGGDDMEIIYYVFPADLDKAKEDFNVTLGAMEFYASVYGEYPFIREKYAIVECATAFAGMEYQTNTFYSSYCITGDHSYDHIVVHELSHMWWGDMVTNENWHNTWLNEGFATYSEALYYEHMQGVDAYHQYMDVTLNSLGFVNPIYRYDTSDPFGILEGEVYDKGAWVLHMLRHLVGDETFFDILAEYRARYAFGTVTTEDFQGICEQVWGQDPGWFFQQWIYEPWHPEYEWGWQIEGYAGGHVLIGGFIDQIQEDGPVFTMPLDLVIVTAGGDTITETVYVDEQSESFHIAVDQEPAEVLLDPFNWVLKEAHGTLAPDIRFVDYSIEDNGDGDGRPDPGETASLRLEISNTGVVATDLTAMLSTSDPQITITDAEAEFGNVGHNQSIDNSGSPFTFIVEADADVHLAAFYLAFSGSGGYTASDTFYLSIGDPGVLLVDDDGGDEYERLYWRYLAANGVPFQSWSRAKHLPGDTLRDFDVVVWFTGRTREQTLTADDQAFLSAYLDNGGRLFLSGLDIGHDLVETGNGAEFFSQYLHAGFVMDASSERFLQGASGDPITGSIGLLQVDQAVESPDAIAPLQGASATLVYSTSPHAAGIRYSDGYRLVYFAVGLEAIDVLSGNRDAMRTTLMDNVFNWLQFVPSKGDVNEDGKVNILDVIWTVNIILGLTTPTSSQSWAADFNNDATVNILDAIAIVNDILGPVAGRPAQSGIGQ